MATVTAYQSDTLDAICYRHYGVNSMNEAVLEANPQLAKLGVRLPEGTQIVMPEKVQTDKVTRLWD